MSLTQHQNEVLQESLQILKTSSRLVIKGSAGVGKTYMVNELIKQLAPTIPRYKGIYCSAPTHKAVAVIKNKVDSRDNLSFITAHSALKLKRKIHYKTGDISFEPAFSPDYPPLKGISLFIIDESSMINIELLSFIEEYSSRFGVKVIFIGDEKQLNPVKEEDSPVFTSGYPEVELTEIIRQGEGNPIIDLSRDMGKMNKGISITNVEMDEGYLFSNNEAKVIHELAKVNGTDAIKYLAWTNKEVDKINNLVRREIYGNPGKIEVGETLIFNAPYGEDYFTNEEIYVESVEVKEEPFSYMHNSKGSVKKDIKLKYYSINYKKGEDGLIHDNVIVIHEDSEKAYKDRLLSMKIKCKSYVINWRDYFKFAETFADLKYNHAITVHKSQGSTYENAIVNLKNLKMNKNEKEKQRLMYTAITRASKLLIIYNH